MSPVTSSFGLSFLRSSGYQPSESETLSSSWDTGIKNSPIKSFPSLVLHQHDTLMPEKLLSTSLCAQTRCQAQNSNWKSKRTHVQLKEFAVPVRINCIWGLVERWGREGTYESFSQPPFSFPFSPFRLDRGQIQYKMDQTSLGVWSKTIEQQMNISTITVSRHKVPPFPHYSRFKKKLA